MTREDVWFKNNGQEVTTTGWQPFIQELGLLLGPGYTLLRTRISVDLSLFVFDDGSLTPAFPQPAIGWQTAVAVCFSADGPPAGYYSEVGADWIWVSQVSWRTAWFGQDIDGVQHNNAVTSNTIDSRVVDSKSRRKFLDGSDLYLVVDSIEYGSVDSSLWLPTIQWTSRVLVEQPPI